MKTILAAILMLAATSTAFACNLAPGKSRAEVKAELTQFNTQFPTVGKGELSPIAPVVGGASLTRAQVLAELKAFKLAFPKANSAAEIGYPQDSMAPFVSTKTRAEVNAELKAAKASGSIGFGELNQVSGGCKA